MEKSQYFRKRLLTAASISLSFMLVLAVMVSVPIRTSAEGQAEEQETKRTVNVSAQGRVQVAPDIAYVTLGVLTENKDAKIAQQNNAKQMEQMVKEIKEAGIAAEDIKTTGYGINPKYNYDKDTGASSIIGYSVNNTVQVTVRDISKTGSIIDIASASGANISNGISFGLSDYDKYYNEALKKAVETGKSKANTIADALGVTLKAPVTVNESGGYYPSYSYKTESYAMDAAFDGGARTPVEAGSLEVSASVSMTYEY